MERCQGPTPTTLSPPPALSREAGKLMHVSGVDTGSSCVLCPRQRSGALGPGFGEARMSVLEGARSCNMRVILHAAAGDAYLGLNFQICRMGGGESELMAPEILSVLTPRLYF